MFISTEKLTTVIYLNNLLSFISAKAEVESESEHSSGEEELEESVEDPTPSSSEAEVTPMKNGNKRGPSSKSGQPTKKPKLTVREN